MRLAVLQLETTDSTSNMTHQQIDEPGRQNFNLFLDFITSFPQVRNSLNPCPFQQRFLTFGLYPHNMTDLKNDTCIITSAINEDFNLHEAYIPQCNLPCLAVYPF